MILTVSGYANCSCSRKLVPTNLRRPSKRGYALSVEVGASQLPKSFTGVNLKFAEMYALTVLSLRFFEVTSH